MSTNEHKRQKRSSSTLAEKSQDAVNRILRRRRPRGGVEGASKINEKQGQGGEVPGYNLHTETCGKDATENVNPEGKLGTESLLQTVASEKEGTDESDWEDGSISTSHFADTNVSNQASEVTIEFDASQNSARRKPTRRVTAEDKEAAEFVHKVHLLCLLARGRLIDKTCNDPLIQAALLSLIPPHLLTASEVTKLTATALTPFVTWFHNNFHARGLNSVDKQVHSALAAALETHEGTMEEVVALSVALFRALNFPTRFVSILDVASLKPEVDKHRLSRLDVDPEGKGIFDSSTLAVSRNGEQRGSAGSSLNCETNRNETSLVSESETKLLTSPLNTEKSNAGSDQLEIRDPLNKGPRRKGDLEFEMQLEMALSTTALAMLGRNSNSGDDNSNIRPSNDALPFNRMKRIRTTESSSSPQCISTAIGSRKVGAPLYWAEVYCNGENMTGRWVHVDVVNSIIDGEQKVEAAAAACKKSLRYAVAFAGNGAKDVTRRYCMKWYKIAPKRVNSVWWDSVLAPLKELEAASNGGVVLDKVEFKCSSVIDEVRQHEHNNQLGKLSAHASEDQKGKDPAESSLSHSIADRASLEDMELETRALTEPLPSNQQAYRNHRLYAIEKWLTKYQILHPKGPVLGFCSGHPVYPRSSVQTLHTKERWLREGLQVRENEQPVKMVKGSLKQHKGMTTEMKDCGEGGSSGTVALFGKWQTESVCLPQAVDGIVPKNERGQVDVWSEKCLPPGTVHLRLPRLVPIVKRLQIDFAPAMVGFEFRNGCSVPVYEGLVVCSEFKNAILEAYAEEEERRKEEEKMRNERQAASRWYQLLCSIVTRQRLNNRYGIVSTSENTVNPVEVEDRSHSVVGKNRDPSASTPLEKAHTMKRNRRQSQCNSPDDDHEHVYMKEDETFNEESLVRTKRCQCGFSVEVEEL